VAAVFFFPDHFSIATNFKNPATTSHEINFLAGRSLNLSRHTVGFRTVVSLLAIFDLNGHKMIIAVIPSATNQNFARPPNFVNSKPVAPPSQRI
jgi:hypothetical protein|tara:strand:- start:1328 stop:1609 length:282 start_codon:yes stop_codon:yes gene_type:complete